MHSYLIENFGECVDLHFHLLGRWIPGLHGGGVIDLLHWGIYKGFYGMILHGDRDRSGWDGSHHAAMIPSRVVSWYVIYIRMLAVIFAFGISRNSHFWLLDDVWLQFWCLYRATRASKRLVCFSVNSLFPLVHLWMSSRIVSSLWCFSDAISEAIFSSTCSTNCMRNWSSDTPFRIRLPSVSSALSFYIDSASHVI